MEQQQQDTNSNINQQQKQLLKDIPLPPKHISTDEEIKKIQDTAKLIKKTIDVDLPDYFIKEKFEIISKVKKTYIFGLIFTILFIILSVIFWLSQINLGIKILVSVFGGMLVFFYIIFVLVRLLLFNDLAKLQQKIILFRGDYIKCHFFGLNKRYEIKLYIPSIDGREINLGKGEDEQTYFIDYEAIWIDNNNIPNLFYVRGIPNPINFNFMDNLLKYFDNIKKGDFEANDKLNLDVRYSSNTVKLMKNDKFMTEMHRDNKDQMNNMVKWFVIMVIIFMIILLVVVLALSKQPQVINVLNNTGV